MAERTDACEEWESYTDPSVIRSLFRRSSVTCDPCIISVFTCLTPQREFDVTFVPIYNSLDIECV